VRPPLKRDDYQKQHVKEHKKDLMKNLQKIYPKQA
jgi:hypothetical protein